MVYEKVRGYRVWWLKKNGKSIGQFDINGITSDEESEKNVDDIVKLEADNKALRAELDKEREALNSAQKVMDVYEKQKRALREELAALKQSLAKVRADAIRDMLTCIDGAIENDFISMREIEEMTLDDFFTLAKKHAKKIEAGS